MRYFCNPDNTYHDKEAEHKIIKSNHYNKMRKKNRKNMLIQTSSKISTFGKKAFMVYIQKIIYKILKNRLL